MRRARSTPESHATRAVQIGQMPAVAAGAFGLGTSDPGATLPPASNWLLGDTTPATCTRRQASAPMDLFHARVRALPSGVLIARFSTSCFEATMPSACLAQKAASSALESVALLAMTVLLQDDGGSVCMA